MRNLINNLFRGLISFTYLVMGVLLITACVDESSVEVEKPNTAVLAVLEPELETFEDESLNISVNFVEPSSTEGTIQVSFSGDAVYGDDFTTDPAGDVNGISIPVASGLSALSLSVIPVNRLGSVEESKTLALSFSALDGVSFGPRNNSSITILNRPEISTSGTISDFGNVTELESSASQSFSVGGLGLTGDMELSASENYMISLDDSDFEGSLTIPAADINGGDTLVYVRFTPEFDAIGAVAGTVDIESENAEDVTLALSATGTEQPPTIFIDPSTLDFGSAPNGGVSASQSASATGYRLTEDIAVSVTGPFEISLDDNTYSASIVLPAEVINALEEVSFFTRFAPNSGVDGDKVGTITLSSAGAADQQIALSGEEGLSIVAFTSFEEPAGVDVDYTDLGDSTVSRVLENNDGQAPVQYESIGGELGFKTIYVPTGGLGSTDGDDLGVTTKTSIVGDSPEGGYTDGVQGYYADDTDGIIKVVFDPVDVSSLTTLRLAVDYLFNDTSWEDTDNIMISVETGDGLEQTLLNLTGVDIEAGALDPEPHVWQKMDVDISNLVGGTIRLTLQVETNSAAEEVYFDNIRFLGI